MEWAPYVHDALEYIERNLLIIENPGDIAKELHMSEAMLQRGFHVLTGFSLAEYIRNRKLYEAAMDIISTENKLIDIAYKYGYETPNSFTKAFTRFHGINPLALKKKGDGYRRFLPIKVDLIVHGGAESSIKIVKKYPFSVVGFKIDLSNENETEAIRELWNEVYEKYYAGLGEDGHLNDTAKGIETNGIGEYGVLVKESNGRMSYMVAGRYAGKTLPDGAVIKDIPGGEWAVFDYSGPVQAGTLLFNVDEQKKWIHEISEYDLDDSLCIEWYESIDEYKEDVGYKSALWIPVRRREEENKKGMVSVLKRAIVVWGILLILFIACFVINSMINKGKAELDNNPKNQNASTDVMIDGQNEKSEETMKNTMENTDPDLHTRLIGYYKEIESAVPDDIWGGAYFEEADSDGGEVLYVLLSGEYEHPIEDNAIIYGNVKYSYSKLEAFKEVLIENIGKIGEYSLGINLKENKVVIFLRENETIDETRLKSLVPEDAYMIKSMPSSIENENT